MDVPENSDTKVIEELKQLREATKQMNTALNDVVALTSLDSSFGKKLTEMKKVAATWDRILARFGYDTQDPSSDHE